MYLNGRTCREINISGRCTLCIVKCASFVFSFLILCSPAGNYLFKVNNRNTRTRCEIYSNLTIKIPERCHYFTPYSSVSIVNFEHVIADWVIYGKIYGKYGLKFIKNELPYFFVSIDKLVFTIKLISTFFEFC